MHSLLPYVCVCPPTRVRANGSVCCVAREQTWTQKGNGRKKTRNPEPLILNPKLGHRRARGESKRTVPHARLRRCTSLCTRPSVIAGLCAGVLVCVSSSVMHNKTVGQGSAINL